VVRSLGVDVTMHVVVDKCIPRNRYLRRVTLDTFMRYEDNVYADKEDEPELMRKFVDTTFVSSIYDHIT
jgi:hypothetical protein